MKLTTAQLEYYLSEDLFPCSDGNRTVKIPEGKFKDYKVKFKAYGEHHNDGQLVDYTITIISPTKKKTVIETRMCLMVGWNLPKKTYDL